MTDEIPPVIYAYYDENRARQRWPLWCVTKDTGRVRCIRQDVTVEEAREALDFFENNCLPYADANRGDDGSIETIRKLLSAAAEE